MLTKADYFGHWFYFFLLLGMWLIGLKDYRGWAFRFIGEIGWIGIGMFLGLSSVWMWGFVFLAVDIYNYRKWQLEHNAAVELGEQIKWQEAVEDDKGLEYVKRQVNKPYAGVCDPIFCKQNGIIHGSESVCAYCRDYLAEEKANGKKKRNPPTKRKGKRKKVAAKRRGVSNKKVQPRRRRHSK